VEEFAVGVYNVELQPVEVMHVTFAFRSSESSS